jgi:hypothetical protein
MRYSEWLAKSPLMPKHLIGQPASILLIMAKGRELGVPPLVAIDGIDVIQGKVALKPQLMLGLVRKRLDVCRYLRCTETTDKIATFETHRVGDPEPTRLSFTIEDARKMQLVGKDNYSKQPAVMLRWRAASAICRLVYSDLLAGAYVFGEVPGGHSEPSDLEDAPPPPPVLAPESVVDSKPGEVAPEATFGAPPIGSVGPPVGREREVAPEATFGAPGKPSAFELLLSQLETAPTLTDLEALALQCKSRPDDELPELRAAFTARKAALEAQATASREPGQD